MELFAACERGCIEAVSRIVGGNPRLAHASLNDANDTPLVVASRNGHVETVDYLLRYVSVGMPTATGKLALVEASARGRARTVLLLLERGADPDSSDGVETSLVAATREGCFEVAAILLEGGADPGRVSAYGSTAMMWAANNGDLNIMSVLRKHGAGLDEVNSRSWTALMYALGMGHRDAAMLLLSWGADTRHAEDPGTGGRNALILAAREGFGEAVARMMECNEEGGLDIDHRSSCGRTALMCACQQGHAAVVETLLLYDAELDLVDEENCTALLYAITNGHVEVAAMLIDEGASVRNAAMSPLIEACRRGHRELSREIVERGGGVDDLDANGSTALMWCASYNHVGIARDLLASGASVNQANDIGWTAIMYALSYNNQGMVWELLGGGADVNCRGLGGATPLLISCTAAGMNPVSMHMIELGADRDARDDNGFTPLELAIEYENVVLMKVLLNMGAGVRGESAVGILVNYVYEMKRDYESAMAAFPHAFAMASRRLPSSSSPLPSAAFPPPGPGSPR